MLNRITFAVVVVMITSLLMSTALAQQEPPKIDAHTLLDELGRILAKKTPETKEGYQQMLSEMRTWQDKMLGQLQAQIRSPKYSFECAWVPQQGDEKSRACVEVLLLKDSKKAAHGDYLLVMSMDLIGGHTNKSRGEAWVNMLENPPLGVHIPVDLQRLTVSVSVYAPSKAGGNRSKPNGFQVFVKDKNWKCQYSKWYDVKEKQWNDISLKVNRFNPPGAGAHTDSGFDPTQIVALGVKMGAGTGSTRHYKGPIYIDAVDWSE